MSFSFGGSGGDSNNAPAGGFSFGGGDSGGGAASGFAFGAAAAAAPFSASNNSNNSSVASSTVTEPTANTADGKQQLGATAFSFSSGAAAPSAAGGSNMFGSGTPAGSSANEGNAGGFSFGGAAAATTGGFGFGGAPAAASTTTPGMFGGAPAAPAVGLSFGAAAPGGQEDAKPSAVSGFGDLGGGSASSTTPAPEGRGFGGFGGTASSSTNAATTPAQQPAGTTPGFAFGNTPVAAAGATPPTTGGGGGFSFGGPPDTPGPPAPVATPGGERSQAPAATTTTAAPAPSTTTAATPASVATSNAPTRLEYQTLTVEQILNMFQQEMEKDAVVYLEEARRVAEYDAILRDSQRDLNLLTENVRRCLIEQKEVEQTLTGIGAFQSELDRTLESVERNVDELFGAQSHLMPADADMERESTYKMAHDVDLRLLELQSSLQTTLQQMDAAQERALTGDVAKIVQILNQHQNSLAVMEDAGRRMEHDIAQVNRVLAQR